VDLADLLAGLAAGLPAAEQLARNGVAGGCDRRGRVAPVALQITHTRDPLAGDPVIERACSTDGGWTFAQARRLRRQTYTDTVNVGVMVSSNDRGRLTEMCFTGVEVVKP
jgi:hypothetical protein